MKKALALALVISMAFAGTMFAQATPDVGANPDAPGQGSEKPGVATGNAEAHSGAPGQNGDNPGKGNDPKGSI